MVNLTEEDLKLLNLEIQRQFNIRTGIEKPGLINSIVERPDQRYYEKILYPDIFTKAVSIFEAITRWHVFSDLNKRTALIATKYFMSQNNYVFVIPISAVRFSVQIADDQNTENEYTHKLILRIADWIRKYSGSKSDIGDLMKAVKNMRTEVRLVRNLFRFRLNPVAMFILNRWLAVDIYPEYRMSVREVFPFIGKMQEQSLTEIEETLNS